MAENEFVLPPEKSSFSTHKMYLLVSFLVGCSTVKQNRTQEGL